MNADQFRIVRDSYRNHYEISFIYTKEIFANWFKKGAFASETWSALQLLFLLLFIITWGSDEKAKNRSTTYLCIYAIKCCSMWQLVQLKVCEIVRISCWCVSQTIQSWSIYAWYMIVYSLVYILYQGLLRIKEHVSPYNRTERTHSFTCTPSCISI